MLWSFTVQVKQQLGISPSIFSALLGSICQILGSVMNFGFSAKLQAATRSVYNFTHFSVYTDAFMLKIFSAMTMSYCFTTRQ